MYPEDPPPENATLSIVGVNSVTLEMASCDPPPVVPLVVPPVEPPVGPLVVPPVVPPVEPLVGPLVVPPVEPLP